MDLIIRGATVFDGTGAARFTADVGVTGDRIAAVGDLGAARADREIMAAGKALAPGFIDAHTHDDRAVLCGPECMLCKMSQGVTTVVVGNCGISLSPVSHDAPARRRRSICSATNRGGPSTVSPPMPSAWHAIRRR